jgi:hypothetical protein
VAQTFGRKAIPRNRNFPINPRLSPTVELRCRAIRNCAFAFLKIKIQKSKLKNLDLCLSANQNSKFSYVFPRFSSIQPGLVQKSNFYAGQSEIRAFAFLQIKNQKSKIK